MLKLYNKEHVAIGTLTNLKDSKIEYVLSGEDSLEFSISIVDEDIHLVEEEGYVRNKFNEYVIKAIDPGAENKTFTCNVNLESLVGKSIANFNTNNNNITDTIRLAIAGTGWILADNNITKRRTIRLINTNALEVLREVRKVFRIDFRYDSINKIIYVYEHFGEDRGVYFSDELNLKYFNMPSDTYDYVTRLYPKGKDGLTISSINNGKEYIENFQYSNKVLELIWEDNRYTDVNSLKEDAEAKLNELSKPKRTYQAGIIDLAKQSKEYSFLDFFLGDTITLLSKKEKFRDKQRIVKYIEYPYDSSKNTCELRNTTLTFEELQKENEAKNNTVDAITSGNGTIDGSKVDSITTDQISDFKSSVAEITDLTAINIKVDKLEASNVTITGKLNAIEGEFGTLNANVGIIDKLTVTHTAQINNLEATKASITQLEAVSATIGTLEAQVGKIETLVNGNLTSENIHSLHLTSASVTVENGFIKSAMIESLDVSKVNAGDISTNKFRIKSDNGGIEIVGATQQFKDKNNKVRIQMGQDTKGNFNFILRGEDGTTTLIDHTGIKEKAIANDLIKENMIASNAIGEKQINYSSFITGFNKDTNTSTIKSTKIMLNNQNQTLDVAFNSLKTQADKTKSLTESHSTTIGVMQGQISTAINNTQIIKDGQTILLKDDYNRTVQTIDSMKSTIGSHTSQINGLNSTVNTQGSSIEQLKSQISLKVEQTDINTAINNIEIGVRNYILNSAIKNNTNNFTLKAGVTRNTENLTPNSNNSFYINASNLTSNEWRGVSQIRSGILKIGNVYTISCNIFIPTNHGIDEGCAFEIICWNSSGSRTGTYAVSANRKILDKWQKLKRTFTVPNDTVKFTLQAYVTRNGKFYTGDFSLVQGEKDNWSNAPEDTDKKIDNALLKHMGINLIVNQGTFAPNQPDKDGEFYIHGFDSDGNKADVDGYIINPNTGEKINIAKTMINPNTKLPFNQEVYLCYSNRFWFAWYSTSDKRWKTIDANGNTHQSTAYDLNWNDSQLVLGVVVMSSAEMCASGFLYDKPKNYRDAIGQTIEFTTTKSKVAILETNLNSITSRVSSVETKTTKIDGKVTSLETWKKSAEQKITDSAIISTVSSQFYKKGETDSKYASQTQITQLSNQISSKVDVNGVISTIKQNPSAISVGFNGIDNRIQMTSDGMFFNNVSGKRTLSLKRGYLHLYNPLDSTLMGASIARSTQGGQYYDNGISTVVSNNGYYYSIAKASDWNNDTQATFNPKEYFIINFRDRGSANINKKGIHALDVLFPSAGINMLNASITGANTITANNLSAISFRHPNGNQLFRSDGYNIYNDRNWDWQRRNILDPVIIGGSYGYSASLNATRQRKTSIDTSSILDCINIIEPINTYSKSSKSSLEMDISQLINHPNAHMFIDRKTNNIDMKSMLHLALLEIQKLKKEIQEIRAS